MTQGLKTCNFGLFHVVISYNSPASKYFYRNKTFTLTGVILVWLGQSRQMKEINKTYQNIHVIKTFILTEVMLVWLRQWRQMKELNEMYQNIHVNKVLSNHQLINILQFCWAIRGSYSISNIPKYIKIWSLLYKSWQVQN